MRNRQEIDKVSATVPQVDTRINTARLEAEQILQLPDADASGCFIPTLNNMGYMTTQLDPYSQKFVDHAATTSGVCLEIGAAYGIATLAVLSRGGKIICNDLDARHLALVKQQAAAQNLDLSLLTTMLGDFLTDLDLAENSIEAILICRVLHFLNGQEVEQAMQKMFNWLKPGGKVFIIADTPYLKVWTAFIPEYEQRVSDGVLWPGIIANLHKYFPNILVPNMLNTFDVAVLSRVLTKQGFDLESIEYLDRQDFPPDRQLDGRESIAAIACKPN